MSSILFNTLASNIQSLLGIGSASKTGANAVSGSGSTTQNADSSQLSPFAQLMSTLQQLQQSNPAQYQQVTQQISTNLQSAAQTATSNGNTAAATQLNQLSTDFANASQSGQLPNIQDLAQAVGGGGHHHHHHHAASAPAGSDSSSSAWGTSSTEASATSSSDHQPVAGSAPGGLPGKFDPERLAKSNVDHLQYVVNKAARHFCTSGHVSAVLTPASSASSRHFHRQSASANPISRNQASCVSTSSSLLPAARALGPGRSRAMALDPPSRRCLRRATTSFKD